MTAIGAQAHARTVHIEENKLKSEHFISACRPESTGVSELGRIRPSPFGLSRHLNSVIRLFSARLRTSLATPLAVMTNSWGTPNFTQGSDRSDIKMEGILSKLLVADNEVIQKVSGNKCVASREMLLLLCMISRSLY